MHHRHEMHHAGDVSQSPPPLQTGSRLPPPLLGLFDAHSRAAARYAGRGRFNGFSLFDRQVRRLSDDPDAIAAANALLARRLGLPLHAGRCA